ncbi:transposase family protein [Streptomyces bottropensis]|uniref:helix-turn-helix domain-containing protein n=1 Tax=Streptomyces bottropensis TaxID=42235 RepID=UPI00369AD082
MADLWPAGCESALRERRGTERQREAGAGPKYDLAFTDRVLVTLVRLRTGLPHAALAELYGTARSTISRAIGEIRPLLATRGFAVTDRPSVRLRTLADVFAYAEAEGIRLRIDGTETQVHRPKAGRPTTTVSDGQGRLLLSGADRPGRMHDQTTMRIEGIAEQFRLHPEVGAEVDEGYQGLANEFPNQASAPPARATGPRRGCCRTPGPCWSPAGDQGPTWALGAAADQIDQHYGRGSADQVGVGRPLPHDAGEDVRAVKDGQRQVVTGQSGATSAAVPAATTGSGCSTCHSSMASMTADSRVSLSVRPLP